MKPPSLAALRAIALEISYQPNAKAAAARTRSLAIIVAALTAHVQELANASRRRSRPWRPRPPPAAATGRTLL